MQVLTDLKSRALRIARIHLTTARRANPENPENPGHPASDNNKSARGKQKPYALLRRRSIDIKDLKDLFCAFLSGSILAILKILAILLQTKKRARARETKTPARKPCKRS